MNLYKDFDDDNDEDDDRCPFIDDEVEESDDEQPDWIQHLHRGEGRKYDSFYSF